MADNDQKIEVEFSLKDDMSPILRAIEDMLRSVNSGLAKTGTSEGNAISRLTQSTRDLGEEAKRSAGFLDNMGGFISGVARTLGGPGLTVGTVAYGVAKVAESMDKFALASINMKNFSRDTGFTVEQIQNIQLQYQRAGEPISAANQQIQKFGTIFDELIRKETTAPFFQELYRYNQTLAYNVLDLVKAGERWKAIQLLRDAALKAAADGQTVLAGRLNELAQTQKNTWTILNDNLEGAAKLWRVPEDKLKAVDERISEFERKAARLKDIVANFKMDLEMRRLFATIQDPEERRKAYESLRKQEGTVRRELPGDPFPSQLWGDIYSKLPRFLGGPLGGPSAEDLLKKKEDSKNTAQDISDTLQRMLLYPLPQARQEGGAVLEGQSYRVGEDGPEMFAAGGGYRLVGEGGEETFRPPKTGRIISELDAAAREYQPSSAVSSMLGKAMGPAYDAAQFLKRHTGGGDTLKSQARKLFGIEDPGEPAPWASGGEWGRGPSGATSLASREADTPPWSGSEEAGTPPWSGGGTAQYAEPSDSDEMGPRERILLPKSQMDKDALMHVISRQQQREESQKWRGGAGALSQQLAPSGIGWEKWRRSQNIDVDTQSMSEQLGITDIGREAGYGPAKDSELAGDLGFWDIKGRPGMEWLLELGSQRLEQERKNLDKYLGNETAMPKVNGSMIFDNVPPHVKVEAEFNGFDESKKSVNKQPAI